FLRVDLLCSEERSKRAHEDGDGRIGSQGSADHGGAPLLGEYWFYQRRPGVSYFDEDSEGPERRKTRQATLGTSQPPAEARPITPISATFDRPRGGSFRSHAHSHRTGRRSRRSASRRRLPPRSCHQP